MIVTSRLLIRRRLRRTLTGRKCKFRPLASQHCIYRAIGKTAFFDRATPQTGAKPEKHKDQQPKLMRSHHRANATAHSKPNGAKKKPPGLRTGGSCVAEARSWITAGLP